MMFPGKTVTGPSALLPKIDPNFPYDAYRFLPESLREADGNKLLERLSTAFQQEFERTHAKILSLPKIHDFGSVREDLLPYLKWHVGWSDEPELSFAGSLAPSQLRKLLKLSMPLWRRKGTRQGLVDAFRVFTGRTAGFRDWFYYRSHVGEVELWRKGREGDPLITGGLFSPEDEVLSWIFVNREGLTGSDKRLIFELLSYILPLNERYGIVYAALYDDFLDEEFALWEVAEGEPVITQDRRAYLPPGTTLLPNSGEFSDWGPLQSVDLTLQAQDSFSESLFCCRFMDDGEGSYYEARLGLDGSGELACVVDGVESVLDANMTHLPPPSPDGGESFHFHAAVSPVDEVSNRVRFTVCGQVVADLLVRGAKALRSPAGGLQLRFSGSGEGVYLDNVVILASPVHVQYVGQRSLRDQGYIATYDPGSFTYSEPPGEPSLPTFVAADWHSDWSEWELTSLWHVSQFSALAGRSALWFSQNDVGVHPYQVSDPHYAGSEAGEATSPTLDLSDFPPEKFGARLRLWFRRNQVAPEPGPPEEVRVFAGEELLGLLGSNSRPLSSVAPNPADPRVGDGRWWEEEIFYLPDSVMGASASFGVHFTPGDLYTTTDFGVGITRVTLEIYRK